MFDTGDLNLFSLVLGLAAWILPLVHMSRLRPTTPLHRLYRTGLISFFCCALALVFQLYYQLHLVDIQDWSAMMDTTHAVCRAAAVLLAGTALVNLPLLLFSLDEKKKAADQRGADRA